MARIGSLVESLRPEELDRRILVAYTTGAAADPTSTEYLWFGDGGPGLLRRSWHNLWRRLRGKPGADLWRLAETDHSDRTHYVGLVNAIEADFYTRKVINDYGSGDIAFVAAPFGHYLICGNQLPNDPNAVESSLRRRFGIYFGYWAAEARASFRFLRTAPVDANNPRLVQIYFGLGVYAPGVAESPIGHLEIASLHSDDWTEPVLGGPNGPKAAFYPGQLGVAFGYSPRVAPAFVGGRGIPEDYVFYFGRLADSKPPVLTAVPRDLVERRQRPTRTERFLLEPAGGGDSASAAVGLGGDQPAPEEGQVMLVTSQTGERHFRLRWRSAGQQQRLLAHRPAAARHLRLDSLLLPRCGPTTGAGRWWVDLDERGRLANTPLAGRRFSLTGSLAGLRVYDHEEMEYRYHASAKIDRAFPLEGVEFRWSSLQARWNWGWRVQPDTNGVELGFLMLPDAITRDPGLLLGYGKPTAERLVPNWVDPCAGVSGGTWPWRSGGPQGLARWSFGNGAVRLWLERNGTLTVQPFDEHLAGVFRPRDGQAAGRDRRPTIRPIRDGRSHELKPGEGLVIGCYLFFLEGG